MSKTVKATPPNSLIFISDSNGGVGPEFVPGKPTLSTSSVISISCLAYMDGDTKITLRPASEVDPRREPAWDQLLETPSRKLVVSTIENDNMLSSDVPSVETRVRVWTNETMEPDNIVIGWG